MNCLRGKCAAAQATVAPLTVENARPSVAVNTPRAIKLFDASRLRPIVETTARERDMVSILNGERNLAIQIPEG